MKMLSLRVAICLVVGFPLFAYAGGCEYDTQCKGDRICENAKCVSPPAANAFSKPAEQTSPVAPASKSAEHGSGIYGVFNKPPAHPADASYFCCTISDKLGPYPNPGSDGKFLHTGDACSGTTTRARLVTGRVCD